MTCLEPLRINYTDGYTFTIKIPFKPNIKLTNLIPLLIHEKSMFQYSASFIFLC